MVEMENSGIRNDSSIIKQTDDKKAKIQLIITISLYILGIALLTTLVFMIPALDRTFMSSVEGDFDSNNFFFKWTYDYYYSESYYIYDLNEVQPFIGFYIFLPLVSIIFLLAGSCVLITKSNQKKIAIFISWILNLAPIIAFIFISLQLKGEFYTPENNLPYFPTVLGFYPIYSILPFQLVLIINNELFVEFIGLKREVNQIDKRNSERLKLILALIMLFFILAGIVFPYLTISNRINEIGIPWIVLLLISFLYLYLIIIYLTLVKKQVMKRFVKDLLAFCLPLFIFASFFFISAFMTPWYYWSGEFISELLHNITFPVILRSILMKWAFVLIMSFPIGFYSRRRLFPLFTALYTASIVGIMYSVNIIEMMSYFYRLTLGKKIYYIIDPIIIGSIFVLGAFIGRMFKSDFWPEQYSKPVV